MVDKISTEAVSQVIALTFPADKHPRTSELNNRVLSIAAKDGYQLYLVGGYVRDALLNKVNCAAKDLDYAVAHRDGRSKPAMELARSLAAQLDAHHVPLDQKNDTARIVLKTGEVVDLAGCVGGSIESDITRRDFSVNALFWDPEQPEKIIDKVGGLADLENLSIRAISEKSIIDDPLRMLRAFRFSATIGATIERQTLEWITKHRELMKDVAAERINYELFLTLAVRNCSQSVVQLANSGLLEVIFPELVETRRVTANAFHHLGLFEHSIETIPQLESRYSDLDSWVRTAAEQDLSFGVSRLAATKLACILHDIGKPATWDITPEGRHTFYGHDKVGADMCVIAAERMKWARPVEKFIVDLVKWHLRPGALFHQGPPTDRAVRRFYRSIQGDLPELMLLAFADLGATRGPGLMGENRIELEKSLLELLNGYTLYKEESSQRPKLMTGTDVMQLLSIKPGPVVGQLLTALEEAQEFKEVLNLADAEAFVKTHYLQKYSK